MPTLAVYIVPPANTPLYQAGATFLGYDAYTGELTPPTLATVPALAGLGASVEELIGRARIFGFHATLGDALDFAEETLPEIHTRLAWLASRFAPFTLVNGRVHRLGRYLPNSLTLTFDDPGGSVARLHYQIATLFNVLYRSSPFYEPMIDQLSVDDRLHLLRYGVPHFRILDRFDLHFSLATSIPDQATWDALHAATLEYTALGDQAAWQTLAVEAIHLLVQQEHGSFRISASFPLTGRLPITL